MLSIRPKQSRCESARPPSIYGHAATLQVYFDLLAALYTLVRTAAQHFELGHGGKEARFGRRGLMQLTARQHCFRILVWAIPISVRSAPPSVVSTRRTKAFAYIQGATHSYMGSERFAG